MEEKNKVEGPKYWQDRPLSDTRKDWNREDPESWIQQYWDSKYHPHRELIIEALATIEFDSVLEVGSNCGPNLALIQEHFPETKLAGVDINADAIEKGKQELPEADFSIVDITRELLPYPDKSFDIILADACLMYVPPDNIVDTLVEMFRVSKKGIIIVDFFDESDYGTVQGGHWARNYEELLEALDMKVDVHKLNELEWPTKTWSTLGRVFVAHHRSPTSRRKFF